MTKQSRPKQRWEHVARALLDRRLFPPEPSGWLTVKYDAVCASTGYARRSVELALQELESRRALERSACDLVGAVRVLPGFELSAIAAGRLLVEVSA